MFNLYYIPNTLNDLNADEYIKSSSIGELKNKIPILIIDDKEFSFIEALGKHEFRIKRREDLADINDVMAYDVILCDIRGVGKFLDSQFEGANLIKEIKTHFPNKYIIAYTANEYDANFETYLEYADKRFSKGSLGLEDWVEILEEALLEQASPVKLWKRTRKALLKAGVPTVDVAKYESDYVKAVKNGDYRSFEQLCNTKTVAGGEILRDLTTSVIAKLLKP